MVVLAVLNYVYDHTHTHTHIHTHKSSHRGTNGRFGCSQLHPPPTPKAFGSLRAVLRGTAVAPVCVRARGEGM